MVERMDKFRFFTQEAVKALDEYHKAFNAVLNTHGVEKKPGELPIIVAGHPEYEILGYTLTRADEFVIYTPFKVEIVGPMSSIMIDLGAGLYGTGENPQQNNPYKFLRTGFVDPRSATPLDPPFIHELTTHLGGIIGQRVLNPHVTSIPIIPQIKR